MTAARAIACTLAGQLTPIELKPSPVLVKTPSFPLALVPPPVDATGAWTETQCGERLVCRYYDSDDVLVGFGVAPQEAGVRQQLLAELGAKALDAAACGYVGRGVEICNAFWPA